MNAVSYQVKRVSRADCEEYLLHIHYAHRWPQITYAFGLFYKDKLCGVITYGTPSSAPLRQHIAGLAFERHIIELTRLCLKNNIKNEASLLVGRSIKMLPKNKIIISFADTGQNHLGCVYQAANFEYTGLSVPGSQIRVKGMEHLHELAITGPFRGLPGNSNDALRAYYGDRVYKEEKSRKHRYVYFHGTRKFKKAARLALQHNIRKFPKRGDTIEELENSFKDEDNIVDVNLGVRLSSKDFEGLLI